MKKKKKTAKKGIAIVLSVIIALGVIAFAIPYVILPKLDIENLYYDDHIDLGNKSVIVLDEGKPTSNKVGSETEKDDTVITLNKNKLIATGVGNAKVMVNGRIYKITVSPAPISIFMITGHSLGAGECGNVKQSVVCEEGEVYSSHGKNNLSSTTEGVGLGYTATNKANNYNLFTREERGTVGEGSALGYEWNRLTGEKVYILNTAVGGSCINSWVSEGINYRSAVAQFNRAQEIVSNEIVSGHFNLSKMGIFYHNAANFTYAGLTEYTQEDLKTWYEDMWNGYKEDLSFDMDKDGENENVDFLGLVPAHISTEPMDAPCGLYLGASGEYEDIFIASLITKQWKTDESINANFPENEYPLRDGVSLTRPTKLEDVLADDNVHFDQVAYNAVGIDIAKNLYAHYYERDEVVDIKLYDENGQELGETVNIKVNETILISPEINPVHINDLTFEASICIEFSFPLQVKAVDVGTGILTIKRGETIIKSITFNCTYY